MKIKPQSPGTPIRRSHPLAVGLVRAWIFNGRRGRDSSGWTFRDAVAGDTATYTRNNADTLWGNGLAGPAFTVGADGGVASFQATQTLSRWGIGATSMSVVGRVASFGSNPNLESVIGGSGFVVLTSRRESGDTNGFNLAFQTGGNEWMFGADGSGQFVGASHAHGGALTASQWYTVGGTYIREPGVATYGGYWSIYVDGRLRGTNNKSLAGSFAGTFTDRIPKFNGVGAPGNTSDKRFDYIYVWNRALSPQEVAWVTDQPFDLFVQRRAWAFAGEAAAAGGSTIPVFRHHYVMQGAA